MVVKSELGGTICPNCGYVHLESNEEAFVRSIYVKYLMDENDNEMESLEGWYNNREYELSGEREKNLQ
jgi:hypothetical protein